MSLRVLSLALLSLLAASASATDWPQWRGPNRDGICTETGLLKSWPTDGPSQVWTASDLGTGYGTPSIANGKIYGTGTRDGKDGVWALNELDGKELWFTPFDAAAKTANNINGAASTPTVSGDRVYAVSGDGTVAAINANTGKLVWTKSFKKDFGTPATPRWGFNESVLVDGDKVICAPSSAKVAVAALKASTGQVIWTVEAGPIGDGAGYSSPIKATLAGIPTYVVLLGKESGLVGVNADTGKVVWQYKNPSVFMGIAQIPTPIVSDDKVWVSTAYGGGSALLQIVPAGKNKAVVKELKTYSKEPLNHHGGMILLDGYIYFGHGQNNGIPTCVNFKTGEKVWQADRNLPGGNGSAAYLYADGLLYIRYQNGVLFLVSPSPKEDDFKVISSFKLPAPNTATNKESWPHPVIANGKLYIRDQNKLYCYNVKGPA